MAGGAGGFVLPQQAKQPKQGVSGVSTPGSVTQLKDPIADAMAAWKAGSAVTQAPTPAFVSQKITSDPMITPVKPPATSTPSAPAGPVAPVSAGAGGGSTPASVAGISTMADMPTMTDIPGVGELRQGLGRRMPPMEHAVLAGLGRRVY